MVPNRYRLSPRARSDLEAIWLYTFQTWSRTQADEYYDELIAAIESLSNGAKRGKRIDDIRPGYLSLSSGSHFIIYKQNAVGIIVVRILHRRMNIRRHF